MARSSRAGGLEVLEVRELMTDPIRDINPTLSPYGYGIGSSVRELTPVGDTLFFVAYSPEHGTELWKTNGTEQGTKIVRDIRPGATSTNPRSLTNLNGKLFFVADDGLTGGSKLWTSNGTEAGTDVVPGILSTSPNLDVKHLSNVKGTLFFTANAFPYPALFRTDGTSSGTVMLTIGSRPPNTPAPTVPAGPVVEVNGDIYFPATGQNSGNELWKLDSTEYQGAVLVKDVWPGSNGSSLSNLTNGNGTLYFTADDGQHGTEIWSSDGTSDGTNLLIDANAGPNHGYPRDLTVVGNMLFFAAARSTGIGTQQRTLWKTNGPAGTTTEVLPPDALKDPVELRNLGGQLYFQGNNDAFRPEPWTSDGTSAGTRMIHDIYSGGGSTAASAPTDFVRSVDTTYFTARDPDNGREIWQTDGTFQNTRLALDVWSGSTGSSPDQLLVWKDKLVFTASSEQFGEELYVIDLIAAPEIVGLVSPTAEQRPIIDWNDVQGAVGYELQIFKSVIDFDTGRRLVSDVSLTESRFVPTADLGIGDYYLHVRAVAANGLKSAWSPFSQLNINTPVQLLQMSKTQLTSRPTVSWLSLFGASSYDLWLSNLSTGQSPVVRTFAKGTSWTPSTDLPIGKYRVWVRGLGAVREVRWSTSLDFDVVPASTPTSPVLPTFNRHPTFAWTSVTGALRYDLYVRSLNTGVTVYYPKEIETTSWTPPANLVDGPYRWWVQAVGANGVRNVWSAPVDIYIGGRTNVTAPTGISGNSAPVFAWQAVQGAARYELWVADGTTQVRVLYQTTLTSTTFSSNSNLAKGSYRVWVRAVSTSGENAVWSAPVTFSIAAQGSSPKTTRELPIGLEPIVDTLTAQSSVDEHTFLSQAAFAAPTETSDQDVDTPGRDEEFLAVQHETQEIVAGGQPTGVPQLASMHGVGNHEEEELCAMIDEFMQDFLLNT